MQLMSKDGITTRRDGLPYDVVKVEKGVYQFRAIAGAKPVVIATTSTEHEAIMMLVAQAPEDKTQASINTLSELVTKAHFSASERAQMVARIAQLESAKVGA